MAVRGFESLEIASPRGMWSVLAERHKGNPSRAASMQNYRIGSGWARSRPGTSATGLVSSGKVTAMRNWITPTLDNLLLYQDGDTVKSYNQATTVGQTLLTGISTTRSISWADLDVWMYFCGYDVNDAGTFQVRIFDGTNTDKGFRGPVVLTAATAVDGGPGNSNAGIHFVGFVYQNRTGFAGVPTTTIAGVPISVNLATDGHVINITATLPALTDGGGIAKLYLIMTTSANSSLWYFIPTDTPTGSIGVQDVPYNTPITLNFVANFADAQIQADLDPAQNQFLYVTQDGAGNGPFNPNFVVAYGQRMVYGMGASIFISNLNNPQQGALDQNVVAMTNKRPIAYAFPVPGSTSLYVTGDRWTGYVTDNNDIPATWPVATVISEAQGAPFPGCVCFKTKGPYTWVVTQSGPFHFDGTYGEKPLTYLCSDLWDRVNWQAAYAIQIKDDVTDLKLYIAVPMDGATEPTAMFVIDYQNGLEFDQVDISLDNFNPAMFSSIEVVKEVNALEKLWIGPSTAAPFSHFDSTTHNDLGNAIDSFWETGLVIPNRAQQSAMVRFNGASMWIVGEGVPIITVYGLQRTVSFQTPLLIGSGIPAGVLSPAPGINYLLQYDLSQAYNETIRVETNSVDAWSEISMIEPFYMADLWNR